MIRSLAAALFALLPAFAALAQQPGMRAQVLIVESLPDFERWAQSDAPQLPYSRGLAEVPVGKPVHFPIVVSGLRPASAGLNLVADIEFFAPNGSSLGVIQQCCRFTATPGTDVRMAVLGNAATLVFGANDVRGNYSVAISVTDGAKTVTARESIPFGKAPEARPAPAAPAPAAKAPLPPPPVRPAVAPPPPRDAPAPEAPSAAAEAPKLRMSIPEKNPGKDGDKRDCLSLSTPAEIIKCAEKKK